MVSWHTYYRNLTEPQQNWEKSLRESALIALLELNKTSLSYCVTVWEVGDPVLHVVFELFFFFFPFNWELPSCLLDLTTVISVAGFWLLMMGGFFRVGLSHRFCPHHLCCSVKITSSCTVPFTEIFQSDGWASQLSRTWWEIYHLHTVHVAALAWPLKVGIWMPQSWMLSSGRMLPTEHFKGFVYSSIFMLVPWI